jgi:regulator of protease activity HflC (stomatin/prohibitin superfamily)
VQHSGLRFRIPFIEQVVSLADWGGEASKQGQFAELAEQQSNTRPQICITKDNVNVSADAVVYWRIVDPAKARYEIDILPRAIRDVALNALRSSIGALQLDTVLSERASLNERIASELVATTQQWGIQLNRVELQELRVDDETARTMRQEMEAERRRRALVAEAEGRAAYEIKAAEALRQAAVKRGQGEAEAMGLKAEADAAYYEKLSARMGPERAHEVLMAEKYVAGFNQISQNPADKVFLPSSPRFLMNLDGESRSRDRSAESTTARPSGATVS